jgi:hypothetical protein
MTGMDDLRASSGKTRADNCFRSKGALEAVGLAGNGDGRSVTEAGVTRTRPLRTTVRELCRRRIHARFRRGDPGA